MTHCSDITYCHRVSDVTCFVSSRISLLSRIAVLLCLLLARIEYRCLGESETSVSEFSLYFIQVGPT